MAGQPNQGRINAMKMLALVSAVAVLMSSVAFAQQQPQSNPLQPRPARPAAAQPAPVQPAPAAAQPGARSTAGEAQRAPRQRSAAQLANDERMRKCGAEWRANKAQLEGRGQTWRTFNVECRARLKAAGQ
jgi:hypothetical protein